MDRIFDHIFYVAFICFLPFWIIIFSCQVGWVYIPLLVNVNSFERDEFIVTHRNRDLRSGNGDKADYYIGGHRASDGVEASLSWRGGTIFNQRYGVWGEGDTIPIWSYKKVPADYMIERDGDALPASFYKEIWTKIIIQTCGIIGGVVLFVWLVRKYRIKLQEKDE